MTTVLIVWLVCCTVLGLAETLKGSNDDDFWPPSGVA